MTEKPTYEDLEQRVKELEQDAVKHKRVEEQLSEKDFIIRSASSYIATANLDGILTYVNQALFEKWGFDSMDEMVGHPFPKFWMVDNVINTIMKALLGDEKQWSGELQAKKKDGSFFKVQSFAATVFDEKGTPIGLMSTSIDITERKQAEEELKQSEENLNRMFQFADYMVCIADLKKGYYLKVSPAFTRHLGWNEKEMLSKPIFDFIHPADIKKTEDIINEQMEKEIDVIQFENRFKTKKGDLRWFEWSAKPVPEEGITYAAAYDITERKQAEEALRAEISERKHAEEELMKLASVVRYSSELVNLSTLDGKMIFLNKAGGKMLGIEPEEVEHANIIDVIPDHLLDLVKKELFPRLMENHTWEGDLQYRNLKTGEHTDVHAITFTIQDPTTEKPMYLANVSHDITERKRTQEIMIQSEKMLSVGGLAAGMAHEINNPLAGILQNVQVMKNRMSHDLEKNKQTAEECGTSIEAIEAYMEKRDLFSMFDLVVESGKRVAKVVNNMLSFSRKSESRLAPHDLGELLDKTLALAENDYDLKKKFDFRQIEIVREYDKAMSQVMCEGSKIQQVILNILKNGAQAMTGESEESQEGDGRNKPQFILRTMTHGNMARIEIGDNGPGMDESTRKRVFEPFFTTKGVGVGTGLGLSVSYFIITENHDGNMAVESTPGKGAKFIIQLPFEKNVH